MTTRTDLNETTEQILAKIDSDGYLVQFDVPNTVFFLTDKATKEQYNMPTAVQFELDSRYWRHRDPVYWEANFN